MDFHSWIPEMQKGFNVRLASPNASRMWFDAMTKMNEKQMERCIGMLYFLY